MSTRAKASFALCLTLPYHRSVGKAGFTFFFVEFHIL